MGRLSKSMACCSSMILVLVGSACSSSAKASDDIVKLTDYAISPGSVSEPAGKITFVASNDGTVIHEMIVAKTNLDPGKLPLGKDGKVDESKIHAPGEVSELEPGKSGSVILDLKPGTYVLFCNVMNPKNVKSPGNIRQHYKLGMRTAFTVT